MIQTALPGFAIGNVLVDPPVLLAPMEDVTNIAYRRIAKRIAQPGLMFTEFVSAMAIHHGAEKTLKKMRIHAEERPLGIQIFGGEPAVMAETARIAEEMGADLVDINMGCWVPKVCKTGSGAALLKDPDNAEAIVSAVVGAVRIPVTVKVRAGFEYEMFTAPDLAERFEGAGARMLTLHARFAKQGFTGEADWKLIAELRKALTIPLVGNGDIRTPEDALRMMKETGCDGVMIGRAAISDPWALARICFTARNQAAPSPPTLEERIETCIEHARLTVADQAGFDSIEEVPDLDEETELRGIRRLRGQLPLYIKGLPGAAQIRGSLSRCSSLDELETILYDYQDSLSSK